MSTVDKQSTDSVVSEDATASMVAKIITEQLGRIRGGLAFKKKPVADSSSSGQEDMASHTTSEAESLDSKQETESPASSVSSSASNP